MAEADQNKSEAGRGAVCASMLTQSLPQSRAGNQKAVVCIIAESESHLDIRKRQCKPNKC